MQRREANGRREPLVRPGRSLDVVKAFGAVLATVVISATSASAKEIRPGDLLLCGARHCRAVTQPAQARGFASFLWGAGPTHRAPTPRGGSPFFQLRWTSGPVAAALTRTAIRVYGLNCGRFRRGRWYVLPRGLRGLTAGLEPKRLRAPVPRSC